MKRFICLLLISALFSGMTANAQLADNYIFSESFCDSITNSADGGNVIASADEVRIINSREGDKALRLEASLRHSMSASAEFSGADDTFVVSFDIKGEGFIDEGKLNLYDGGGSAWKLLGFSGKDSVQLPDGKKIPGANISANTHFDVLVEQKASAVSVYVNGKCAVYRWYVNQMPKGIGKAELAFSAGKQGNANVIVDGIWVYNANIPRPAKSLPNEKYNPEEAEYTPTDFNSAEVGDSVYITRTFDETNTDFFTGFVSEPGPNTVEKAEERNGNAYVRIVKNYTTSGIFDVRNAYSERYVVEADLSMGDELLYGTLYVRGSPDSLYLLRFSPDGTVTLDGSEKVCKLSKGKWEHLAIVVDMSTSLLDIYLNGELLYNDYELPVYIPPSSIIRFYIGSGATGVGGELRIDNLKIYDGTEPMKEAQEEDKEMNTEDIAMNDANTLLSPEAVEKELLKDAVAVASSGVYLAKNGEKIKLDAPAYEDGESFMLPLRAMAAAFGFETGYNADTKEVTVADISIKDGAIYSGGAKVEVKANPVIKNGITYIGAEEFAKYVAKKTLNVYSHGVAVLSDKGTAFNAEEEKKVNAYLFYERPDAGKILADFENKKNVHPRVVFDQEHIDRLKRLRDNNDKTAAWIIDAVISSADRYAKMKPAVWDDYKGVRASDHVLGAARGVRDRLYYIAFAYLLTGNKDYIEPAWKQIQVAAEYEEWGELTTFLAVGETLGAYAVAYDWMYDAWTDEQRTFIEETMMKKGLEYSYMAYRGTLPPGNSSNRNWYWWENNWNQVCNGGTVMAAAALLDKYPAECAQIISDAIRSNENSIEAFYPLGAYAEGMGYQSYALRYLTPMYQTLKYTLGTDYNMLKGKGLSNVFNFSNDLSGPTTMPNNYHDASEATPSGGSAYLWCFADLYRDKNYFDERMFQMETIVDTPSIYDAMFYNPETDFTSTSQEERSPDAYYKGEELVSLRGAWQDTYTPWVSFHGGENNLGMHGHIDTGAFILEMLGERWSLDLGSNTYTNDYWGDRRYTYYKIRAEGHNTLVINPDRSSGQVTGSVTYAQPPVIRGRNVYSTADLSEAYSDNASNVKRGFLLTDDRSNVVIRDEIALKNKSNVYWFMHTDAQVTLKDSKTAVLNKNGKSVYVRLLSNAGSAVFSVMDAKPLSTSPQDSGQNPNEGIRKLAITANESGAIYFQVSFSSEEDFVYPDTAIDEWDEIDGGTQLDEAFDDGKFSGLVKKGSAALLDAGYAKKGKALILGKDSEVYYSLPKGDNQTVTMSVSMRAEKESSVISGNNTLLKILSDGYLEFLGERVMLLVDKHWYNFAIEAAKAGTTLYINGEKVKTTTATELSDIVLKSVSGGGFDDLSVYSGICKEVSCELEFLYSYYVLNDTIFIAKEIKTSEFLNRIAGRADVDVYSDLSGGIRADFVGEDTTVALRSDDGRIVKYYNVSTNVLAEELLTTDIEKAKSLGKNKALAKGMFTGGISSTEIKNFNGTTAFTRVSESGSGKNGVSYYFEKVNSPNTDEMTFDFKFIPNKESGTVTFEISIKAPDGNGVGKDIVKVYLPYNGTYNRMIVFDDMGQIALNNSVIEKYKPGRWYNFAISFHIGTKYADFYLDGEWIGKNELWRYYDFDKIEKVGGRFRISNQITGLAEGKKYSGTAAFDDISVYAGEYYPEKYTPRLVRRDGKNGMRLNSSCSLKTLRSQLAESFGTIKLYSDESFNTPDAEYVSDGQLLTIASDRIVKYFDVEVLSGLSYDKGRVTATIPEEASLYLVSFGEDDAVDSVKKYDADSMYTAIANGFDKALLWHKDTMTPVCEELIIP